MRLSLISFYGLLMLAVSIHAQAQQSQPGPGPGVKTISKNGSTVEITTNVQQNSQSVNHFVFEASQQQKNVLSGERRVLVKFKGQPLAKKSANASAVSRSLNQDHARFLSDLQQLSLRAKASGKIEPKILAEFKNVFNGYALIIPSDLGDEIRKLPYVASVVEDQKVKAIDESSNQVIKADQVWTNLNITGRGVVIGIIDTGIDYNHADLGGGIGSSFKVLGGYDFVNNDSDPIDDHGHGTHVAGIAAAKGSIKGVAPDARLMAFKVLDAGGYGWDSWIIAGIERSVDPDQNPATNDAVNVVNMSLGRAPMADDPYIEAIANATALGVTFVVAAGNSGNYFTVGAPGVAPDAITVGATDLSDVTAPFSSKGPTEFNYQIKPDVSAPGVAINSTFLQNQFAQFNGTSMASPHVAGAAALLLEKNPSWTPEMIKGALMNNAKQSTETYWSQGAGRIDVLKSIQSPFIVTPGSISLGKYNTVQSEQKTYKTTIYNTSNEVRDFAISVTGDIINSHVTAQVQPSVTVLNPGESKEITITFNTASGLPDKSFTEGYFGKLLVTSEDEVIQIPVSMINMKSTRLIFSTPLPNSVLIMGTGGSTFVKGISPTSTEVDVILPNIELEIVTQYGNFNNVLVIKEGINGMTGEDILLTRDLAKNRIVFGFTDVSDNLIDINPFIHIGTVLFSTQKLVGFYLNPVDTFYVSDNSVARFDFVTRDKFDNLFYDLVAGVPTGQNESITIIKQANIPFDIKRDGVTSYQWQYVSEGYHYGKGGLSIRNVFPYLSNEPIRIFASERKATDAFTFSKAVITDQNGQVSETGLFGFYENDLVEFRDNIFSPNKNSRFKSDHFTYETGNSLLRWNGKVINQTNQILLYDLPSLGLFNYVLNERNREELDYELKTDGQIVSIGKILNRTILDEYIFGPIWQTSVTPGIYSLSVKSNSHQVNGVNGYGQIDYQFDTRKDDKDPPMLNWFSLLQEGVTTNKIKSGERASFMIGVSECNMGFPCYSWGIPITAKLLIKSNSSDWQELELVKLKEDTLVADINEVLPEGYYSAKVIATDLAGNNFTYTLSPAFFVSPATIPPVTRITLLEPLNHASNVLRSPQFSWESIDAISYTFELSKSSTFAVIESTITQPESQLMLPATLEYNTVYYWRVKPNYETGSGAWSDIFDFRSIEHRTNLLFPQHESRQSNASFVTFEWEAVAGADYFHIQVSRDPYFRSIEFETGVLDTSVNSWIMPEDGVTYYWRVETYLNIGMWISWSEVFSFTGDFMPQQIQLLEPLNNSVIDTRKPFVNWTPSYSAVSYTIQFSRYADFSEVEQEETTALYYHALTEPLDFESTYYWRVRPNYENESGSWSDSFQFTIEEEELILLQPFNNSFQSNSAYVNFTWENPALASEFHFQLSKDPDFSTIEYESELFNQSLEWTEFPEENVVYYWRVRAYYFYDYYADWSETFSFTVEHDDYITTLLTPDNNSVNASLQPIFRWTQTPQAQGYTFQISRTPDFSSVDLEYETLDDFEPLPNELEFSTLYYWRVRAHYEDETRPWSDVFNFRVEDAMLTLESPADQSMQASSLLDFEWSELNNVAQYHFQLSKDVDFNSVEYEEEVDDPVYQFVSELESNSTYYWRVRPYYNLDYFGEWSVSFSFTTDIVTSLPEQVSDSKKSVAYPNPFIASTTIEFYVARAGEVSLEILNPQGQAIDRVTKFFPLAGRQSLEWKGNDVAPGVYLCKITLADKTEVVKLIRSK